MSKYKIDLLLEASLAAETSYATPCPIPWGFMLFSSEARQAGNVDPVPSGLPFWRPQGSYRANTQFKYCPAGLEPLRITRQLGHCGHMELVDGHRRCRRTCVQRCPRTQMHTQVGASVQRCSRVRTLVSVHVNIISV